LTNKQEKTREEDGESEEEEEECEEGEQESADEESEEDEEDEEDEEEEGEDEEEDEAGEDEEYDEKEFNEEKGMKLKGIDEDDFVNEKFNEMELNKKTSPSPSPPKAWKPLPSPPSSKPRISISPFAKKAKESFQPPKSIKLQKPASPPPPPSRFVVPEDVEEKLEDFLQEQPEPVVIQMKMSMQSQPAEEPTDLIQFLTQEKKREDERRHLMQQVTDPIERRRLDKIFDQERARARAKLLQLSSRVSPTVLQNNWTQPNSSTALG
jgi:hypothetical protein